MATAIRKKILAGKDTSGSVASRYITCMIPVRDQNHTDVFAIAIPRISGRKLVSDTRRRHHQYVITVTR
jgi:hypothetical protein